MVDELHKQQYGFVPGFAVVHVGNRENSNVYIRHKLKAAEEIGIQSRLDSSTTERQVCLIKYLQFLNLVILFFQVNWTS